MAKLLAEKKKREAKLRRKQEKEEKKEAKLRRKQEKEEKKEAKRQVQCLNSVTGDLSAASRTEFPVLFQHLQMKSLNTSSSPTTRAELKVPAGGADNGHVNWAFRHEEVGDAPSGSGCRDDEGDVEQGRGLCSDTHSVILDLSTTSFVDTVTVKTLKNVGAWFSAEVHLHCSCSSAALSPH